MIPFSQKFVPDNNEILDNFSDEDLNFNKDPINNINVDNEDELESNENSEEESLDNEYPGYKIGYYKITFVDPNQETITIQENLNPYDIPCCDDDFTSELEDGDELEMEEDHEFASIFLLNALLEKITINYDKTNNPYAAILTIQDFLFKEELVLPEFTLDFAVDEWIYDIQLKDISDQGRSWYLHLEILKNEDFTYDVFAGLVPF